MNDGIMYVWQVMRNEPYERLEYAVHTCARKSTAEYLRDWCEAIEYDRVLNSANRHGWNPLMMNRDVFSIEESEVVL